MRRWLHDHDIAPQQLTYSASKDSIKLSLPVKKAEDLLRTKYHVYQHADGTSVIRTPEWSIPTDIHQHVAAIQPTNSFLRVTPRNVVFKPVLAPGASLMDAPQTVRGSPKLEGMKAVNDQSNPETSRSGGPARINASNQTNEAPVEIPIDQICNPELVTPACLRALYRTNTYIPTQLDRNYVAFANYLNETSMDKDLQVYLQRYRPDAQSTGNVTIVKVNGGSNDQVLTQAQAIRSQNAEGNLDGQTLVGITYPMRVKAYNTGGKPPFKADEATPVNTNEPYLEWLDYMLANETDLPSVVSTSYGDNEQTAPRDYAILVCQKLAMLGSRGVTLLFASGDNGVGNDGDCNSNDGKDTPTFLPAFPDGCPYVTSVGGTKNFNPEVAAWDPRNKFASGGGFSNYFPMPDYQKAVVTEYITNMKGNYSTMYNASGRAYPDLAASSQGYSIQWNNRTISLDGTSVSHDQHSIAQPAANLKSQASTPTVAGIIALLNDYLLANNKTTLGFMNPWLYKVGWQAFNDITSGSARGCDVDGFQATKGWDAVTGFGTPDFPKLQQLALAAGTNITVPTAGQPSKPSPVLPQPLDPVPSTDVGGLLGREPTAPIPA